MLFSHRLPQDFSCLKMLFEISNIFCNFPRPLNSLDFPDIYNEHSELFIPIRIFEFEDNQM
jgi:hypothetical protein